MAYLYTFLLSMLGGAIGASIYLIIHTLINKKRKKYNEYLDKERCDRISNIFNIKWD